MELESPDRIDQNISGIPEVILRGLPLALGNYIDSRIDDNVPARGSILTTYEDDDKLVWRELRPELVRSGVESDEVKRHRRKIKEFFEALTTSEITDEDRGAEQSKAQVLDQERSNAYDNQPLHKVEVHGSQLRSRNDGPTSETNRSPEEAESRNSAALRKERTCSPMESTSVPASRKYQAYVESGSDLGSGEDEDQMEEEEQDHRENESDHTADGDRIESNTREMEELQSPGTEAWDTESDPSDTEIQPSDSAPRDLDPMAKSHDASGTFRVKTAEAPNYQFFCSTSGVIHRLDRTKMTHLTSNEDEEDGSEYEVSEWQTKIGRPRQDVHFLKYTRPGPPSVLLRRRSKLLPKHNFTEG